MSSFTYTQCEWIQRAYLEQRNSIRDFLTLKCDWNAIRELIEQMKKEKNKQIIAVS